MCVGDADEAGGKIFFITITIIFIININISAVMVLYADWFGIGLLVYSTRESGRMRTRSGHESG